MKSPGFGLYLLQFWLVCSYLVPFLIAQDQPQTNCRAFQPNEEVPIEYKMEFENRKINLNHILYNLHISNGLNVYSTLTVICPHEYDISVDTDCGNCWELIYVNSDLSVIPTNMNRETQNLARLKLSESKIQKIEPGAFAHLPKLLMLDLQKNNLTKISRGIFNSLENLRLLNLSHNSISEIEEDSFHGSSNIEILDLSFNKIEAVPSNIFQHQELKTLNISNNFLTAIDCDFFSSQLGLDTLILDNNRLEEFPSCLVPSLSHLSLKFNSITSFNPIDLPISLEVFLIGNNRIHRLDQSSFHRMTSMRTLDMSNNFLGDFNPELLNNLEDLEFLDVSGNNMRTINTKLFSFSKSLQSINLGKNNITTLPRGIFQPLSNLTNLDVSENNITSLEPGVLSDLVSLQMLNLSHNEIGYLKAGVFNGMKTLKVLDLSSNQLDSFRFHVLRPLENLSLLDISYNRITSLSFDGRFPHRRISIALDGNNFTCTKLAETISDLDLKNMILIKGKTLLSENIDGVSCRENNGKTNAEGGMPEKKYLSEKGKADGTEPNVNNILEYLHDNLTVDFSKSLKNDMKDFINFENESFRYFFQQMEDIRKHNESTLLEGLSSTLVNEIESFVTFENSSFQNFLNKMSEIVDRIENDRNKSEELPEINAEKLISSRVIENNTELIEAINQLKLFLVLCSSGVVLLVLGVKLFPAAKKRYFNRKFYEPNQEIPMLS